jgi:predicted dehydrogenase
MGERLLRAALDHDPAILVAAGVWDPSAEAMRRLGRDLPEVQPFSSAEAVIAACDCVYIATPPAFHLGYARDAFRRGRSVFCEKPLAIDLADAEAFVRETESEGARAAVNFVFASSFAVDQLRRWLIDGSVGEVCRIDVEMGFAQWPRPWQAEAAGFMREVGSHFLFLARRLFGALQLQIHSIAYPEIGRSERGVTAQLQAGIVPVSIEAGVGTTSKPDYNIFRIEGAAGSIRLRDWAIAERLTDGEWQEAPDSLPNEATRPLVLKRQLDKTAALTRRQAHDLASLQEAVEVQRVVETILRG